MAITSTTKTFQCDRCDFGYTRTFDGEVDPVTGEIIHGQGTLTKGGGCMIVAGAADALNPTEAEWENCPMVQQGNDAEKSFIKEFLIANARDYF